jgi:hypothetical protein
MMLSELLKYKEKFSYILLLLIAITGCLIFRDYGMCWDEMMQAFDNGLKVYNYVIHGNLQSYLTSAEKYHGGIYEFFLYALNEVLGITNRQVYFQVRHIVNYLFFAASGIILIKILTRLYAHWFVTVCGLLMYFLMPRIFADSFYNTKDVPFLAVLTLYIYTFFKAYDKLSYLNIIIHAAVCGVLIGLRINGLIFPVISLIFLIVKHYKEFAFQPFLLRMGSFSILTVIFIIIFWPILWHDPLFQFQQAWMEMSHFNWDNYMLFKGKMINSGNLPHDYIPFWFIVTTPPVYLLFFLISVALFVIGLIRIPRMIYWLDRIYILNLFFIPVLTIIVLGSSLYDAWRHMFFIYVPFVIFSCIAIKFIVELKSEIRYYGMLLVSISFLSVLSSMIDLHPYQNVYFNQLYFNGLSGARFKMEMDYWGLTYYEAFRYIEENDKRARITVLVDNAAGMVNREILPPTFLQRLDVDMNRNVKHDYFIGNYRWMQSEYTGQQAVYYISRRNTKLCAVFKY